MRLRQVLLGVGFTLLAAVDLVQLVQAARGAHPDPPGLLITHVLTGTLSGLAAFAIWRDRRWVSSAVVSWGVVTSGMLVALGPVLEVPPGERPQLWMIAAGVIAFSLAVGWYVRRHPDPSNHN